MKLAGASAKDEDECSSLQGWTTNLDAEELHDALICTLIVQVVLVLLACMLGY